MSDMTSPNDTFSEKSRLLDIALKYTNGDIERAKLMVSNQYNDVKIIKGKFDNEKERIFGIFLVFVNIPNTYIMNIAALILPSENVIAKASIFDSWKAFYADLAEFTKNEADNALPSYDFNKHVSESLQNYDIFSSLEGENLENLTEIITDIICKFYGLARLNCKINIDSSSSLSLETTGIPVEEPRKMVDNQDAARLDGDYSSKIKDIESKADYVINGRVIISPIKGKYINDIKTGEKIKILLTGEDQISFKVAKSLNALTEENEILPINIRIVEKFPMEKTGYYIYGLAAKNVLVRITEEENIKIETDSVPKVQKSTKSEKTKSDNKMILYIVMIIGLLFIIMFLIFILL
ncbi:MAG: hypothetical protein JW864_04465 [Spirochaetes bacterium]|nr:hypothetical protein [Spirochaetota bacterium]